MIKFEENSLNILIIIILLIYIILVIMEADKNPLSAVPCVQISPEGIFKYILIKAIVEDKGQN